MKHYTCIAHQAFKESCIYFYEGTYTTEELEDLTIKKVKEEIDDKDPDIYVDLNDEQITMIEDLIVNQYEEN